jgi:DNA-binding ferritin-like protein
MKKAWQTKIVIGDLHEKHEEGKIEVQAVARALAERIKTNGFYLAEVKRDQDPNSLSHEDNGLVAIVEDLESIADDEDADVADYDFVLRDLYDWADHNKRIWVDSNAGRS